MKIDALEMNGWLRHRYLRLHFAPMTVIAGPNGAGKTSVADGIAFAMLAELRRIEGKGQRKALISDGADKGSVTLQAGDVTVTRDVGTGKMTIAGALPIPDTAKDAVPCLLDAARFARLTLDERRELLYRVMRVSTSPNAILAILAERKHPEHIIAELRKVKPELWAKHAETKTSEARGAWKAITGEAYGSQKAEGWAAAAPDSVPDADALAADEQRLAVVPIEIGNLQRSLGSIEAHIANAKTQSDHAAELRRRASVLPRLRQELEAADTRLETRRAALADAEARKAAVDARRAEAHMTCPHCEGKVMLAGDGLEPYIPPAQPATKTDIDTAVDALAGARIALREAETARKAAADAIADAEAAERALQDAAEIPTEELHSQRAAVDHELTERQAELAELQDRINAARHGRQAAERTAEATAKATAHHTAVKEWTAAAAALAPDGIPGELLIKAIGPFNDTLREAAAATRWPQVAIGPDMAITAGARPYGLLSESERWRADVMLTVALAIHSAGRFVILDRFDVLDMASRRPALVWLYQLTQAGTLDTALVLGTFKEPPKVPPAVTVHWLGDSTAAIPAAA